MVPLLPTSSGQPGEVETSQHLPGPELAAGRTERNPLSGSVGTGQEAIGSNRNRENLTSIYGRNPSQ